MKRTKRITRYIRYNFVTLLYIGIFAVTTFAYMADKINIATFLASIASLVTLYFGSLKSKIENDLLFKELFKSFNDRYDKRFNDLINNLKADQSAELTPEQRNLIIDYFNLCAEEYLWKTKSRIPDDVWKAWKAGMLDNLEIKQINDLFEREISTPLGKVSYYGLYDELKVSNYKALD